MGVERLKSHCVCHGCFQVRIADGIVGDGGLELKSCQVFDSGRGGHFHASAPAFSPTLYLFHPLSPVFHFFLPFSLPSIIPASFTWSLIF